MCITKAGLGRNTKSELYMVSCGYLPPTKTASCEIRKLIIQILYKLLENGKYYIPNCILYILYTEETRK